MEMHGQQNIKIPNFKLSMYITEELNDNEISLNYSLSYLIL